MKIIIIFSVFFTCLFLSTCTKLKLGQKDKKKQAKEEPIMNIYMEEPENFSIVENKKMEQDKRAERLFNRNIENAQTMSNRNFRAIEGIENAILKKLDTIERTSKGLHERIEKNKDKPELQLMDVY